VFWHVNQIVPIIPMIGVARLGWMAPSNHFVVPVNVLYSIFSPAHIQDTRFRH